MSRVDTFPCFRDMLQSVGVSACLPDMADCDLHRAVQLYHSFPGYEANARDFGVLAIHISLDSGSSAGKVSHVRGHNPQAHCGTRFQGPSHRVKRPRAC